MLANWQLIAIRIVESLAFLLIVVGSIVAAIVPVVIAAGFSNFDLKNMDNVADAISAIVIGHWILILYILAIITILLGVLIVIHSFVEAGNARVFVDADRAAGAVPPARTAFRAFNMDRWLLGGRTSWWSVFWIYNIAWGIGGLFLLIPLFLTIAGMLLVSDAGARVAMGCGGLILTFLFLIPIGVIIAVWTQKAIAVAVARAAGANAALSQAWAAIRADLGRHLAVAFIVFVVAFGGAMVLSMFTMPMSLLRSSSGVPPFANIAFAPAQIVTSVLQSIFSAAVGLWFLASYIGLTEER